MDGSGAQLSERSIVMGSSWIDIIAAQPVRLSIVATLCSYRSLTYLERISALRLDNGAHTPEVIRAFMKTRVPWWSFIRLQRNLLNPLRSARRDDLGLR